MERSYKRSGGCDFLTKHRANPRAHLAGGLVGERNGENLVSRNALANKMIDTRREHTRLPATSTRKDRDGAAQGEYGLPLCVI